MQVGYQHANPHDGRESTLVRFHDEIREQTACVLVDAGDGVDVDDLLGPDDYLAAIVLTHAHLDHYLTLGSNLQDGAPIHATPETASAIRTRLDTDAEHADLENPAAVRDALDPITDWTTITPDVRVHPVPAGHAPGACGFVLQFADGDDRHHLLATGDFTTRRAAGYPGLQTDLPVDAALLTAATRDDVREQLTGAVATCLERATAGSTVLTTASGSTGVQLAYLLAHASSDDQRPPVTVTGRVATLWDAYGYDHPAVESVPTFEAPDEVLAPGRITIAGPEVPVAGSSERLFESVEADAGATLVQVTSGAFEPVESAGCTVDHFQVSNHPTEETIDSVVEELAPIHVVVTHQQGRAADRYKDKYDCFVWATDDEREYVLYDDEWSGPPWVTEATRRRVRSRQHMDGSSNVGRSADTADVPLPTVERRESVDLDAEGIDVERLPDEIDVGSGASAGDGRSDGTPVPDESTKYDPGASEEAVERDETAVEGDEEGSTDGTVAQRSEQASSLADVVDRLDRIEDAVAGERATATVVDAGDGVTLLRLDDGPMEEELTHGQQVELVLQTGEEPETAADTDSPPCSDDDTE